MSQFYDQASLVMVPSGYKSGKIYSQKPLSTSGELSFSRASTATRVNASGLIESVASGVPRLDYSGGASCPSLLLEPQRTNLLPYSEQIVDSNYPSSYNITSVQNSSVSPDGYTNADTLSLTNTGLPYGYISRTINSQAAGSYTFSIFAKAGTTNYAYSEIYVNADPTPSRNAYFNLASGSVESSTNCTASIEDYGSGWYRCLITTTTSATYNLDFVFQPSNASTRNATGNAIFWGAQAEAGAYATSYIPTLSSAVTRVADAASKTGISSLIGQTEGTLFVEVSALNGANEDRQISINDGTASNRVTMALLNNGTQIQFVVQSGGSVVMNTTQTITGLTTGVKIAYAYKVNDFAVYVNGSLLATDTNGAVPVSMSAFSFDAGNSGDKFFGKVSQALLFKTRLSNADLATLTTL